MKKSRLFSLTECGQEVWHDDLYRELVLSGTLRKMIDQDGVSGLTSNPTIFENALKNDPIYRHDMEKLIAAGKRLDEVYHSLLFIDIRLAAQAFEKLYDSSMGELGHVCLEVSPLLAYDEEGTYEEVKKVVAECGVENLLIKVPGTEEGARAIERLVSEGYGINVTLLFSPRHYERVARAYIDGLKARAERGERLDTVRGVASVFMSRIDTAVDGLLTNIIDSDATEGTKEQARSLMGKASVAIGRLVYRTFLELFDSDEFAALEAQGAHVQKPLWASTGTKNPAYSDVKYVESFIYPDTVVTMPAQTMEAFRDHGNAEIAPQDFEEQEKVLQSLAELGIDIDEVCDDLQAKGARAFVDSYRATQAIIEEEMEKGLS